MDWIEIQMDSLTPYNFLMWVLDRHFNQDESFPELEDCVRLFFKQKGVDNVDLLLDEEDGFILLRSGVQQVRKNPPEWIFWFIDSIGETEKHLSNPYQVIRELVYLVERTAYEFGKQRKDYP